MPVRLIRPVGGIATGAVGVVLGRYQDRPDHVLIRFESSADEQVVPLAALEGMSPAGSNGTS
jgi:hypothetical protein